MPLQLAKIPDPKDVGRFLLLIAVIVTAFIAVSSKAPAPIHSKPFPDGSVRAVMPVPENAYASIDSACERSSAPLISVP